MDGHDDSIGVVARKRSTVECKNVDCWTCNNENDKNKNILIVFISWKCTFWFCLDKIRYFILEYFIHALYNVLSTSISIWELIYYFSTEHVHFTTLTHLRQEKSKKLSVLIYYFLILCLQITHCLTFFSPKHSWCAPHPLCPCKGVWGSSLSLFAFPHFFLL